LIFQNNAVIIGLVYGNYTYPIRRRVDSSENKEFYAFSVKALLTGIRFSSQIFKEEEE